MIYDSKDDRRFEVVRKLNQEKTALNTLNRLFSNIIPKVRFSSNEPEMLFDLNGLLEVLDLRNSNENLFFIEWPDGKPLKLIEADTSRCLDANGGDPSCNQGGIAVVAIEGNGMRPSHNGAGISNEGVSYTLNTTEVHGVGYVEKTEDEHDS